MIKSFTKWLETRYKASEQGQYDSGYGYAATQILNYKETPHDSAIDVTIFDRGVRDASITIGILQNRAKKLEKVEQENLHLREIVRKMQEELTKVLTELAEIHKLQALSDTDTQNEGEEEGDWKNTKTYLSKKL